MNASSEPDPFQITSVTRLGDGSNCSIRPLGRDDRGFIQACFEGLSETSRRLRFFTAKRALTEKELEDLTSADGHDHLAFGAFRTDRRGGREEALGVARCIRLASNRNLAEFAVAVIDRAQGKGVGSALLERLVEAARARGIERFRCEVLAENSGMRALAARLGGHPRWSDEGILVYDCALPHSLAPGALAPPHALPLPSDAARPARLTPSLPRSPVQPVPPHPVKPVSPQAPSFPGVFLSWERAVRASVALFEMLMEASTLDPSVGHFSGGVFETGAG